MQRIKYFLNKFYLSYELPLVARVGFERIEGHRVPYGWSLSQRTTWNVQENPVKILHWDFWEIYFSNYQIKLSYMSMQSNHLEDESTISKKVCPLATIIVEIKTIGILQ